MLLGSPGFPTAVTLLIGPFMGGGIALPISLAQALAAVIVRAVLRGHPYSVGVFAVLALWLDFGMIEVMNISVKPSAFFPGATGLLTACASVGTSVVLMALSKPERRFA